MRAPRAPDWLSRCDMTCGLTPAAVLQPPALAIRAMVANPDLLAYQAASLGSRGSATGARRLAERSSALVSIRLRCASRAVAAGVGRPSDTRLSHATVSSAMGPRNSP